MINNINDAGRVAPITYAAASGLAAPSSLPFTAVRNVSLTISAPEEELFFDALDTQPWLTPTSPQWPRLSALASQVKDAIHHQLHLLSQTAMATTLLNVIHPDLSKLLAAVLICSGRGTDIVCQAALMAGLQLINQLIYLAAGVTTSAAILSSLPGLLLIWLQHHHVSLTATLLQSILTLLSSWSTVCALENIGQPGWMVELHQQLIFPVMQLCRESGATEVVMTGITLIVGLYSVLSVSGWLKGKLPSPNMLTDGLRIIKDISQLSARSSDFQQHYEIQRVGQQTKAWYEETHHKPWDESKAAKALNRAVIRCIPRDILLQKDRLITDAAPSSAHRAFEENYHRAYQQTEQQILSAQLSVCPDGTRSIGPNMLADMPASASCQATSSSAGVSVPLLIPAAMMATTAAPNLWWQSRTNLLLAATGVTLLAGVGYFRQSAGRSEKSAKPDSNAVTKEINICTEAKSNIKQLMNSTKIGVSLAVELFDRLFDSHGDINFKFADKLLMKWGVSTFTSRDRNEMNGQILYILSLLLTPTGRSQPPDISNIILTLGNKLNKLWHSKSKHRKEKTVMVILQQLRSHCAKKYSFLEIYVASDMSKISNFLISYVAPDLLFLEQNGKDNEILISKNNYYIWNYIGKRFSENHYVMHDEFSIAIHEGSIDGYVLSRLLSYPGYNLTSNREYLEEAYKEINKEMYLYHKQDIILEAIPIVSFDDSAQISFPGVDLHTPQDFNTIKFRIQTQGRIEKAVRAITECKNYGEIIRNMEDGFNELFHYLPDKIPESLRIYDRNNKKQFTLKKHPTYSELYSNFSLAYEEMIFHHCDLYRKIVDQAFKILPDDDYSFLNNIETQIYAIDVKVKRFKVLRYLFQPRAFHFFPEFSKRISYNHRPHHETGKIFVGYNSETKEKRYYIINIESSRLHTRQFPVRRLPITEKEQVYNLDDSTLNENFIFMDDQPFNNVCDELKEPNTTTLSHWNKGDNFIIEHYHYYKTKLCQTLSSPDDMSISYQERPLGDKDISPLEALKQEVTENRRKFLVYLKGKAHNPSLAEQETAKGNVQRLVELLPFYNCYAFFRDIIISREDITPPSILVPFYQLAICAADFYMSYGLKKTISSLLNSLRQMYAKRWVKEAAIANLNKKIDYARSQPSSVKQADQLAAEIKLEISNLKKLDDEIAVIRSNAYTTMNGIVSSPVFAAFPYLSFRGGDNLLSANKPWGVNMVKMLIKKSYTSETNSRLQVPWNNPKAIQLVDRNNYDPQLPEPYNFSCLSVLMQKDSLALNIFELCDSNPILFHQMFFSALLDPMPESIIASAEKKGISIPKDYNQMSMFFFISLTIPIRCYTSMFMAQQDYYNDKNTINEETLYQYYSDYMEKPYTSPPQGLNTEQNILINQSIINIRMVLNSKIQGVELSYLFMVHYLLMDESIIGKLQLMMIKPAEKQQYTDQILQALTYNLERFTLFGYNYSSMQKKFHLAVINHLAHYCKELIDKNLANTILFSANMEVFILRYEEYRQLNPDAPPPSPADFAANWLHLAQDIADIYHSFARVEYSAKALANFPLAQWSDKPAQAAWLAALQDYLFPEMRYENLVPFLLFATEKLAYYWRQRQKTAGNIAVLTGNNVVNPLFIDDVKKSLISSCSLFPKLYFCNVYQTDSGSWFTFLDKEFISEAHNRKRRETRSTYRDWPVAPLEIPLLEESITLPAKQMQAVLKPGVIFNDEMLYQQQLNMVLSSFMRFASLPFHQRLQSHLLNIDPQVSGAVPRDAIKLINSVIDAQGNIVQYQVSVLQRYLPQLTGTDNAVLLQLLSDIFCHVTPEAPKLYQFVLHHLQNSFADPTFSLASLSQKNFVAGQITEITEKYGAKLSRRDAETQQALQRYLSATLNNLLSFAKYLQNLEPLLATSAFHSLSCQWLCLGAIISHQLQPETVSVDNLLMLAFAAQHDAGLLSMHETAIQQTALLSGRRPDSENRSEATDALQAIGANLKEAAVMQQHILACLEGSQRLAGFINHATFSARLADAALLQVLLTTALQKQRQLLLNALYQLSDNNNLRLTQAVFNGNLLVSWYLRSNDKSSDIQVAGLAFHCPGQPGILLPLSDPQYVPMLFRQLSSQPEQQELTRLCFGFSDSSHNFTESTRLPLSVSAQSRGLPVTNPAIVLFEWMQSQTERQLAMLIAARDEEEFALAKNALADWLSQHLFFYDRSGSNDYSYIREQSEHITTVAAHADSETWQQHINNGSTKMNPVSHFSQAITTLMGASTEWQTLTRALRETRLGSEGGTVGFTSLPENGFAGFWWDPVSHFCYLGWQTGNKRELYASTAENRDRLYPLPDDAASASIWPDLAFFDWLREDVQALRRAAISASKFFDDSIPLAWRLQCAMTKGITPPTGSILRYRGLSEVFTHGQGGQQKDYFYPAGAELATPVTVTELAGGGYRLHFSPHNSEALQDNYFSLETSQLDSARQGQWILTEHPGWQLLSAQDADKLIEKRVFAPNRYLHWESGDLYTTTMVPTSRILQRSDGRMVFIFNEKNQRMSYRILGDDGQLHPSPVLPKQWPQADPQQLDAAIVSIVAQQNTSDYRALLAPDEQQRLASVLSANQRSRQAAIATVYNVLNVVPYRAANTFSDHEQALSELEDAMLIFRSRGQILYQVIKKLARLHDTPITLGELMWSPFEWRDYPLFTQSECDNSLLRLEHKKRLLHALLNQVELVHELRYSSDSLKEWINQSRSLITQAITVVKFIQTQPYSGTLSASALLPLQLQHFAQNYFFSYYQQQLHVTADLFQQPWQCIRDDSGLVQTSYDWQRALDQLHTLATEIPQETRLLDRLLTLPDLLWRAEKMQQRAGLWLQTCQQAFRYWQTPRRAEQIVLLRPKASSQDLGFISHRQHWPIRLILAAGTGDPTTNQTGNVAPPLRLSIEQNEDLLLTQPAPEKDDNADIRLAGINADPRNAQEFAAWSKLRLSTPWALETFSGPAFLLRLQSRIHLVMAQEQGDWSQEERDFYSSPATTEFLQENQPQSVDNHRYANLFIPIFNSNLLVSRLIMTDAEMLFGLMCEHFAEKHPDRATEDLSKAWFLFLHTFENQNDDNSQQPLYLVGV
ncbi:hypothetical protein NG43_03805 [Winslowiella iniecta]|uniref:Toxin n=3 Tax=Winslowiella iniecta TaxID=1560201 RepID=A0A0L7TGW3_9GAMM|nr:hypothetical protein NG43_03805 [Winslowiella iniecta]